MIRLLQKLVKPTSIFLGFTFFGAGMAKLYFEHRYFGWIGPVWLEERLEPYDLALYARFIAFSQIIIGYLLLTIRYRLLGAIMAVPLVLNILMVTISQNWRGTPFVLSVLLLMVVFLLVMEGKRLLGIVGIHAIANFTEYTRKGTIIWGIGLVLNLISIYISFFNVHIGWGISIIGLVISWMSYRWD
ncbi:MAG: hypothetical protein CMB80_25745 [Flammeovirgaceae bacterium]|nr:hypothetical protein [Flammeovirgaceae bacterium]MBE61809.1 hypothetical protein [Flammeovirgaceae bacterium]|tara:strand:- start:735 stop:1295 length:561 start_codon:yes stop_codon:yes gene_type:complete